MATNSTNYTCPACGAPLTFSTKLQKLHCEYCESSFTPEEVEAYFAAKREMAEAKEEAKEQAAAAAATDEAPADEASDGAVDDAANGAAERVAAANEGDTSSSNSARDAGYDPIQAYLDSKKPLAEDDEHAMAVECSSCGATMIVSDVSAVTHCPYCGNNAIVAGKLGGTLEPDLVIPFQKTKKDAVAALKEHYNGKICLPAAFKDANHIEEVQGVYVPFWLYSGQARGSADYTCTDTRVWSDGDYNYTETSSFLVKRAGTCKFDKIPADASKRMPNDHMDSIEPYDYSAFEPFSTAYLPGFAAERYDDSVQDCASRVKKRMEATLTDELRNTVTGHATTTLTSSDCSEGIEDVKYALLPVWMLHTRYNDQDFLFAMNGQTGKLVGDLPTDRKKLNLISLATFAAAFVVTFAGAAFFLLS